MQVFIEKTDFEDITNKEKSCQQEQNSNSFEVMPSAAEIAKQNAIPAGNVFGFAELHYKQSGNNLLQTLNNEINLRIGKKWSLYKNNPQNSNQGNHKNPINQGSNNFFSFFKAPITNTKSHKAVSLLQIYNAIKGGYYKEGIEKLRAISDIQQARKFKAANFDYCTFSGLFTTRNDKA